MPYYVYRVEPRGPVRRLEGLGVFDDYQSASLECRRLRAAEGAVGAWFKMIFAENALRAEELLSEVRAPQPLVGDDY
ncbi:conserved hypothetical protein [Burkholderiales bacterium]|nr:conserved hypothetical protein [Burkholderiales bacterium]